MKIPKLKTIAMLIASFVVFATTYFAMAENKNTSTIFLDSDQDGLTDQEEKMIGTDPKNPDTDNDGYSDGKEVQSGYNPLKAAPGDQIFPAVKTSVAQPVSQEKTDSSAPGTDDLESYLSSDLLENNTLNDQILTDLSSDPDNPNLTNEMIGEFMKLTLEKNDQSENFLESPSFSQEDFNQVIQNSLAKTDISKELPQISDSEIKVLPPIDDKNLSTEEVKKKQKEEIEKYLSSLAFIVASSAPFPVDDTSKFQTNFAVESELAFSALTIGDQKKLEDYAQRAEKALEQTKKVEVPYILKDFHRSILQLAIYSLGFRDSIVAGASDPVKSLAAISSLQTVGESALKLQGELMNILNEYGIESVELK
jgi:hypothetical protein